MKKEQEKKLPNQARLWPLLQDLPLLMAKENLGSQGKFELVHRKSGKKNSIKVNAVRIEAKYRLGVTLSI